MPEALVCQQCGGMLNDNYQCSYCGTIYKKPDVPTTHNVTINVTNNFNSQAATPSFVVQPPTPAEEPASAEEVVVANPDESVQNNDTQPVEDTPSGLENFVNNSAGLLILMLLASAGLLIYGVNTDNEFMILIGGIIGAIFLLLSSKYNKRKDNDK